MASLLAPNSKLLERTSGVTLLTGAPVFGSRQRDQRVNESAAEATQALDLGMGMRVGRERQHANADGGRPPVPTPAPTHKGGRAASTISIRTDA